MVKKFSSILSVLIVSAGFVFAQDAKNTSFSRDAFLSEYVSRTWTASNGLPGNSITDIIQDSTGYIYLGTYDGLVRFDGVEFVTYNRNYDVKYSFVSSRTVFEDSKGNIWNGSNDEGVYRISSDGNVKKFSTDDGLPNNSVRSVIEDKEGRIWIGTSHGVAYIDEGDNIIQPSGLEKYGEENILVSSLYCDTAGRVWVLSQKENGVFVYVNKSFERFKGLNSFRNSIITCIMQDKNTNFWMGVAPHFAVKVDGDDEMVYDVSQQKQAGTSVNSIFQDRKGNMWFSLDTGVTVIHDGVYSHFDTKNGLTDDKVSKIIQDREGNIWLATDRGGIERLSQSKFRTTTMPTTINSIAEDTKRGVVWLAGDDGLYCLKKNTFIQNDLTRMCHNIRVRDVAVTPENEVLVSTYEKLGFIIMNGDGSITSFSKKNGLSGNKVRVAMKSADGKIYIGTTTGLNILNPATGKLEVLTKNSGLANEYIMCIFQDSEGIVWCGTDGGGVFTLKDGAIDKTYSTEDGLIGNVIFKIMEEVPGDIWITTGTGLSRIVKSKEGFVNYSSMDGLGADGIFQVAVDYTQTVWMTSNKGIFCATMDELDAIAAGRKIKINSKFFGQSDGLISAGVTSTSKGMKDSLGRIWFTLIDGFAVYDPLNVTANKTAPLVKIQEIIVDNEKFDWHGEKIILPPGTKRIGIKYTGLSFVSSERTQFTSKLIGFEDDYSDWTTNRYVSYTNLAHGNYSFMVIAANSDGVLSENNQSIQIVKKPYIYEVVWFWGLLLLFVSGVVIAGLHYRFARMRKYQAELEKAVQDRTKELLTEEKRTENLLLNILPREVADELKEDPEKTIAKNYQNATVLFSDIVGFTKMADTLDAEVVVTMLNDLTTRLDERAEKEGVEKIKTMGDAYMAATGLCENPGPDSVKKMVRFAQGILDDVRDFNRYSSIKIQVRIGIDCGKIVAGIIGKSKFIYDIWGDSVNVAFRMQTSGQAGKISVTQKVYDIVKDDFTFGEPVEVDVKGKGSMKTYLTE